VKQVKSKRGREIDEAEKRASQQVEQQEANKKAFEDLQKQFNDSYEHNQEIIRRTTRDVADWYDTDTDNEQ